MQKVIFEQFDGGLQRGWNTVTTTKRAYKNQKKNGIAAGCVNPFIEEGVLVPGIGARTAGTNSVSEMGGGAYGPSWMIPIADNCANTGTTDSIYVAQEDDVWAMTTGGTVITSQWPQTIAHSGHGSLVIDGIADYQIYGIRRQVIFFRDDTDWNAAYYSGFITDASTATERTLTSFTVASPGVVTVSGIGLGISNGSVVRFSVSGGSLPTGITAGTNYFVVSFAEGSTTTTFSVASTKGGTAINTTGTSTGTQKVHPGMEDDGMSAATGYSVNQIIKDKPIIFCTSDNGYLYFGNGNMIHKFDGTSAGGTDGTITGNVLTFSTHRDIADFIDASGKIWILTRPAWNNNIQTWAPSSNSVSEKEISVVVWNRVSTQLGVEDSIIITGCADAYTLYSFDNVIFAWTKSAEGTNQLRSYDGKSFNVVADLGTATSGIPAGVSAASIAQYRNGFAWQDQAGAVYWYGSLNPQNGVKPAVYLIATAPSNISGDTTGGAMVSVNTRLLTGYAASGSATGVYYFAPDSESETSASTTIYTSPIELPKLSTINGVTIFFNENASDNTGTTTVKIYNSWRKATGNYVVTKSIDHDVDIPRGWVYFPLSMENSNIVQLSFGITSGIALSKLPQITRIEVDYTPTTKLK